MNFEWRERLKLPKWSKRRWFFVGVLGLIVGYGGVSKMEEAWLNHQVAEARETLEKEVKWKRVYYGRLSFEVPDGAEHDGTLGISYVSVSLEPWKLPAGSTPEAVKAEYDKRWAAFIEDVKMPVGDEYLNDKFRIVHDEEIQPGVRALYYPDDGSGLDLEARAIRVFGDVAVVLRSSEPMKMDAQEEPIPGPAIRTIHDRFMALLPKLRRTSDVLARGGPLEQVIFLGPIAFVDQRYSKYEHITGGFGGYPIGEGQTMGMGLEVRHYENASIPMLLTHPISCATGRALGVSMEMLRGTLRSVAHIGGEELAVEMQSNGKRSHAFAWHECTLSSASQLQIEMRTEESAVPRRVAVWDHVLESMHWLGPKDR